MSVVVLEGVGRNFGLVKAVEDVALSVQKGEFLTFLGPSGCGKTTTLRMIAGLERNTSGRITIDGTLVSEPERGWFVPPERRQLGMVFQSYAIWPHMTVFENVAYPLRIRRRSREEIRTRVAAVLDLIEMRHLADRPAPALSGGQQQRVAIARALVFEPRVLLLDEPLSNLDAKLRNQMGDEFRKLQKRLGITTLYVTHDQEEAMALSDRIVVMQAGRVLQIGSPAAIYHRPDNLGVARFVGSPNMLPARVESCVAGDTGFRLEVSGEGWRGQCGASQAHRTGDAVLVMIRPENLRPAAALTASEAGMVWQGRVTDVIFRGAHYSVTVAVGSNHLTMDMASSNTVAVGDTIDIAVAAGTAWAVPAERAASAEAIAA
jgi:iron(III) transport system ATP-binding protein